MTMNGVAATIVILTGGGLVGLSVLAGQQGRAPVAIVGLALIVGPLSPLAEGLLPDSVRILFSAASIALAGVGIVLGGRWVSNSLRGSRTAVASVRAGCIYCFSITPPEGVEHVVSKAIGVFDQNWTLDCVCDECNSYFSKTHDLTLGRDSAEGVLRVTTGVKPAEKIDDFRNRSVTFSLEQAGEMHGALLRMRADGNSVVPVPTPQVAFRREGGEWEHVLERDLAPSTLAKFTGPNVEIKILGIAANGDLIRLKDKLSALGVDFKEQRQLMDQPLAAEGEPVSVLHIFNITDDHRRAAAKICFNYMAKVMGPEFARRPEFDVIRRFIRYAEGAGAELVSVQRASILVGEGAETSKTHGLAFEWVPERKELIGLVTFFNEMTYGIRLGHNSTEEWAAISSRHFFDPIGRQITVAPKGT